MTSVQEVLVLIERGCGAAWSHGEAAVLGPGGELRAPCCSLGEDLAVYLLNGTDTMHRAPSCFSTWDGEPLAPCRHLPPPPRAHLPLRRSGTRQAPGPPFCKSRSRSVLG